MKRIIVVLCVSALVCAGTLQSQTSAPKPGPEQKKMQLLAGNWNFERENKATPLRAAGKFTGSYSTREILNGFFVEYQYKTKGPQGDLYSQIQIDGYDAVAKTNTYSWFNDLGSMGRGTFTINGNEGTWEGTGIWSGIQFKERGSFSLSVDGRSLIKKGEVTVDGKTWLPNYELKGTRTKAPSK